MAAGWGPAGKRIPSTSQVLLVPSSLPCTYLHRPFILPPLVRFTPNLWSGGGEVIQPYRRNGSLRLQGQKSEGTKRAGRGGGQRRGRSVPVSGFEAGHLEPSRDSLEIQGFGSWDQTAQLPDSLWLDPD